MTGAPGIYSGRSTSSSSSPGVAGSSPALLVVPQPINATKMGGMQNGGPQPRKYQCKMCPQVSKKPEVHRFYTEGADWLKLLLFTNSFRHWGLFVFHSALSRVFFIASKR